MSTIEENNCQNTHLKQLSGPQESNVSNSTASSDAQSDV